MQLSDLDEILSKVTLPARYIGGEMNMVLKEEAQIRYLLFFPDLYELGMSNLGLQILYFLLNERADTFCERAFSPWHDMEEQLRQKNIPLYSLETYTPLKAFDIIGISLQYELCYTNVLNMLDLAGIALYAKDRGEDDPLIMAGGVGSYNPEPLAEFIDCFYVGEGEEALGRFMDLYREHKAGGGSKQAFLDKLAEVPSIYVPKHYAADYHEDGRLADFRPVYEKAPRVIEKAFVDDMDKGYYPEKLLVPLVEVVHGRVVKELFRGCIRGCRFCQAGFINRPMRELDLVQIAENIKKQMDDSGYEEISLMSLSTSDYSCIKELIPAILDKLGGERATINLPSLRVDNFSLELFEHLYGMKKTSLTFAPEAGSQRLRDVINKNLTEEEILGGVRTAYEMGYDKIKLYFMSGLPSETEEDLLGIARLCEQLVEEYYKLPKEKRTRPVSISASTSCFVPKPHTPFQWDAQVTAESFIEKQRLLKKSITKKQVRYTYHEANMGIIEGALSRGDRRVSAAIYNAFQDGARFDGWTEYFDINRWRAAFEAAGLSLEFYNNRPREYDEILPWDHISCGVRKDFLVRERQKAMQGVTTPNCSEQCSNCGMLQKIQGGHNICRRRGAEEKNEA